MDHEKFRHQARVIFSEMVDSIGELTIGEEIDVRCLDVAEYRSNKFAKLMKSYKKELISPKFKIGDYVTMPTNKGKTITRIKKVEENRAYGLWYYTGTNRFQNDFWWVTSPRMKFATPKEVSEYKAALQFHKHGRKPFEIKKGDLVKIPSGINRVVDYSEDLSKFDFIKGRWKLLATSEEVETWLKEDNNGKN